MRVQSGRRFAWALFAILAVGLALRLGLRAAAGADGLLSNGYSFFFELAQGLASGRGYAFPGEAPNAFRVPLYPMFIAVLTGGEDRPWPLIVAQALLSCGTAALAGLMARRLFGDLAGLIAAAMAALYPYYVWHDTALQETVLFTFLSAAATLTLLELRRCWRLWQAALAGALLAAAILTRATLLPFATVAIVWLALPLHEAAGWRRRLLASGLTAAVLAVGLAPWLAYSQKIEGAPALGTESGRALFIANAPQTFQAFPTKSIDVSTKLVLAALSPEEQARLARMTPLAESRWYAEQARQWMLSHPKAVAVGMVRKLWAAFGPLPSPRHALMADLAYAAIWVPLVGLAVLGAWQARRCWRRDLLFYAHVATFAAITAVLWAHTSHRSYLDVYLMVFAAAPLAAAARRLWPSLSGEADADSASSSRRSGPRHGPSAPPVRG